MTSCDHEYVSKVSIRFAYFLLRFASETVLNLVLVVIDAEFYTISNDISFKGNHKAEIGMTVHEGTLIVIRIFVR